MPISVFSNIASINAQRHIGRTQAAMSNNLSRLSSGLRINSAADDAAGLATSKKLRAQIRSLGQSERNTNDGVSLLQTADGAMNEISGVLIRMRELAIQASNGTVGSTERTFLDQEYSAIKEEIQRLSNATEFNGIKLLDGTLSVTLQVGIGTTSDDHIDVHISSMQIGSLGSGLLSTTNILSFGAAQVAIGVIDLAIRDVARARGSMGAYQNRLNVTVANTASSRENLSAADSRIRDVDVAEESAALTRNNILAQAGVSVLSQANQTPSIALGLLR